MNIVSMSGRLTRDPELKNTEGGNTVVNFSIAVSRGTSKDESDFFDCVAWDKTADHINKFYVKGKPIEVQGELRQERWVNGEGNNSSKVTIVVRRCSFVLLDSTMAFTDKTTATDSTKAGAVSVDEIPF